MIPLLLVIVSTYTQPAVLLDVFRALRQAEIGTVEVVAQVSHAMIAAAAIVTIAEVVSVLALQLVADIVLYINLIQQELAAFVANWP